MPRQSIITFLHKFNNTVTTYVDIGSYSIKLLHLQNQTTGGGFFTAYLPLELQNGNWLTNPFKLQEFLHTWLQTNGISLGEVFITLDTALLNLRSIKLPRLSEEQMATAIKWDLPYYVQYPEGSYSYAYHVFDSKADSEQVDILLIAITNQVIDALRVGFAMTNISGVSSNALATLSILPSDIRDYLHVDIGGNYTQVYLYSDRAMLYTFTLPIGGNDITECIKSMLDINMAQAANLQCYSDSMSVTMEQYPQLDNALKAIYSKLGRQILQELNNYTCINAPELTHIILSGAGARYLLEMITTEFNLPTVLLSDFAESLKSVNNCAYTNVYAAKYKQLNIWPKSLCQPILPLNMCGVICTGMIVIFILCIFSFYSWQLHNLQGEYNSLQDKNIALAVWQQRHEQIAALDKQTAVQHEVQAQIAKTSGNSCALLYALGRSVGTDLSIYSIVNQPDSMIYNMYGQAVGVSDVMEFVSKLKLQPNIKQVQITDIGQAPKEQFKQFALRVTLSGEYI